MAVLLALLLWGLLCGAAHSQYLYDRTCDAQLGIDEAMLFLSGFRGVRGDWD
jgi:hypothetical protein